jgi:uncharacterized protein YbaR (Trm112 family)
MRMEDPAASATTEAGPLPADLLELLRCPLGKAPLRLEGSTLVCTKCGLTYAIEDGIPNMLIEEAKLPPGVGDLKELACWADSPKSHST